MQHILYLLIRFGIAPQDLSEETRRYLRTLTGEYFNINRKSILWLLHINQKLREGYKNDDKNLVWISNLYASNLFRITNDPNTQYSLPKILQQVSIPSLRSIIKNFININKIDIDLSTLPKELRDYMQSPESVVSTKNSLNPDRTKNIDLLMSFSFAMLRHSSLYISQNNLQNEIILPKESIILDKDHRSIIHYAAMIDSQFLLPLCLEFLHYLQYDFNVHMQDGRGEAPLHIAAFFGNLNSVKFFIQQKAPLEMVNYQSQTPLFYAVRGGFVNCALSLINEGSNYKKFDIDNRNIFHIAAIHNSFKLCKKLLKQLNEDAKTLCHVSDIKGRTPLFYAVIYQNEDIFNLLYEWSDIHHRDLYGNSLLHYLLIFGSTAQIKRCLRAGIPVDVLNALNKTPLYGFLECSHLEFDEEKVSILLDAGASLWIQSRKGYTPMDLIRGYKFYPSPQFSLIGKYINIKDRRISRELPLVTLFTDNTNRFLKGLNWFNHMVIFAFYAVFLLATYQLLYQKKTAVETFPFSFIATMLLIARFISYVSLTPKKYFGQLIDRILPPQANDPIQHFEPPVNFNLLKRQSGERESDEKVLADDETNRLRTGR